MKLIDKDKVREWLESKKKHEGWCAVGADVADVYYARGVRFTCDTCKDFLDTIEVKEVSEELAETYMQVFEKKFPILPILKGKQLDKFKNFLNRCRQIFGLQEFGIHPVQAKLFEKLVLLWAAWGAENLQGIGQVKGEPDLVKEVDLEKKLNYDDYIKFFNKHPNYSNGDWGFDEAWTFAKYFYELGLQKGK